MMMMHEMMNGSRSLMMVGMVLLVTLWVLLVAGLIWALLIWLKRRWGSPAPLESSNLR